MKLDIAHKTFIDQLKSAGKSESTVIAYNKDIEQLISHLKQLQLETILEIELDHLQSFMDSLAAKQYTPKSISRKTNATRTFMKYLHNEGHIETNCSTMLKHPQIEAKAPRILSKLEYRALRDAARDDIRSYTMIEVMLQTGVTISEIAEIELEHLDVENSSGRLFVPAKNSKAARNIPLNKSVTEAIKKYINEGRPEFNGAPHLFLTKTGNRLLVRNIRSTINRFFKLAGVENAKVNDLRHTFVAHHLKNGVSLLHLSKIAGHKRVSTTERYLQYIEINEKQEKTELSAL